MKNKNLLVASKVINEIGDWFYYFVIVIIIFSVSHSPIYLGLLSFSYTFPNLIFSNLIAKFSSKYNSKTLLVWTEALRFIILTLMFLSLNGLVILILVFCEQVLAVCSNLNFQNIVVQVIHGDNDLKVFNKDTNTLSTIARLLVIPIYTLLIKIITNKEVLLIDAFLTLIAGLLILPIRGLRNLKSEDNSKNKINILHIKINKTILLIFLLAAVNLIIAFSDSYAISYIDKNKGTLQIGYSVFVFIMTIAELCASLTSKKFDDLIERDYKGHILTCISIVSTVLVVSSSIFHNTFFFIIAMGVSRIVYMWLQIFTLFWLQKKKRNSIMNYMAIQNVLIGIVTLFNSSIGSLIIKYTSIYMYIEIISLIIFIFILLFTFLYRKARNI